MAINFEHLLKLTADFHNFTNDDVAVKSSGNADDELSIEELEFVAAAAQVPVDLNDTNKK